MTIGRPADTYRGARRNAVLRGNPPGVWGPQHYYGKAPNYAGHKTVLLRKPSKYHPLKSAGEYLRSLGKKWIGAGRAVRVAGVSA